MEVLTPNCGRDSGSTFLSRQKLPKEIVSLGKPGDKPHRTVLNVIGNFFDGGRYILDNLKTGSINVNFYKDNDLQIGRIINVFGRKILLTDCDEFTKEFYRNKYGVSDFSPFKYDTGNRGMRIERIDPPYNGFGSEEDSLASTKKMIPEPPKKDFIKWMTYDRLVISNAQIFHFFNIIFAFNCVKKYRNGLESNTLRFLARLQVQDPIQADRRFIISYYLSDDSFMVHEPSLKNSGINGGRFLERTKIKRPNQHPYSTKLPEYYSYKDLFVGAVLNINSFMFKLYDADDYCYKFMEKRSRDMFPYSNLEATFGKLRSIASRVDLGSVSDALRRVDALGTGLVDFPTFFSAIKRAVGRKSNKILLHIFCLIEFISDII